VRLDYALEICEVLDETERVNDVELWEIDVGRKHVAFVDVGVDAEELEVLSGERAPDSRVVQGCDPVPECAMQVREVLTRSTADLQSAQRAVTGEVPVEDVEYRIDVKAVAPLHLGRDWPVLPVRVPKDGVRQRGRARCASRTVHRGECIAPPRTVTIASSRRTLRRMQ
jgi:hypothetical protein